MVSLTRSLNVAKQQWKIAVWISVIVYVLYWFVSKRIQMTRLRFENIHYQVSKDKVSLSHIGFFK